jgi:predicted transcriptional regulator
MADLTITAANVTPGSDASISYGTAGEAITAGQGVYVKSSDGKLYKAQCDGTTEEATVAGMAINNAAAGQPVGFVTAGTVVTGATTAKTTTYMVSAAAGAICPQADLVSTNKISRVGYATDTTGTLVVDRKATGAVV